MSRPTYDRISTYCEVNGKSRSSFVERLVNNTLDALEAEQRLISKQANERVAEMGMTLPKGGK